MSTSQGLARRHPPHLAFAPWGSLFGVGALGDPTAKTIATELYFGGYAPPAVQIPIGWLSTAARLRQDTPYATAEVSSSSGPTARVTRAATAINGRSWIFSATLDSAVQADAGNLAAWITNYYTSPLPRAAAFTLILNGRAETEIWRILGVTQGRHVSITGTTGWPDGSTELVVEGITHRLSGDQRIVTWLTTPIIGTTTGTAGPWFRTEDSSTAGTDVVPF